MTMKESIQYYSAQYRRFKRTSDEIDTIILEYRESGSEELKMILWFNVARLIHGPVFGLLSNTPNKLDTSIDDFINHAYFTFEKCLDYYDVDGSTQFNSFFKSVVTKDMAQFHATHYMVNSVSLPPTTVSHIYRGLISEKASNSFKQLSINKLDDYDDGTIDNYLSEDSQIGDLVPGISLWNKVIKPLVLSKLKTRRKELFVKQFENYYFSQFNDSGNVSGCTFVTIGKKYGMSSSAADLNIKKVLKVVKELANEDEEIRDILYNILIK